ncbi:hypothetical protein EMIHUDRAFT_220481 [Emiliania huxleyi CCMP1516]|uniref:Apple domain-containing protein n=2 Tax=Emiliania huxleyi TaxID=2903 RepID=A0A0D3I168_EMIH1|nr:hypothetical protein EMIHUDRAFT_220481 [Emiliania huxleyi CCMP1516]EOD05003.1 hypothetical protein EMIHUDRAFT_220481 [Emiliania huxleyi CCMP1516]|eukprot:XP_005757432.1 hypothetical protein EMIHUDRAFT_220481 [Emiliania huxleyi CCMP1516]
MVWYLGRAGACVDRAGGPGKYDSASTSNSVSYAFANHATCRRSCDVDAFCVGYSFYAPLVGEKLGGTVAPVLKELETELGALLPERWAQKVAEHGSAAGRAILANSPLELALGVAGWLFLALCFYRCCCRRREPPHKRLVEPDEEEARGGMPSPRPKRRSNAELAEQVAELKLGMKEVGALVLRLALWARAARSERERLDACHILCGPR